MQKMAWSASRRRFLQQLALTSSAAGVALATRSAFAEVLTQTPRQTEGPFYPDHLPLDTDNDLLIVNDHLTQAVGEVTHLSGKLLDAKGDPIRGAVVEIWQCDANGAYVHSRSMNSGKRDGNFQGFGRFLTSRNGEYYFRTIKPVAYPGRTPHIHFAIKAKGHEKFTTQCYIRGEKRNKDDFVVQGIRDARQRDSVMVDFKPIKESKAGELAANFDIVMGWTPTA